MTKKTYFSAALWSHVPTSSVPDLLMYSHIYFRSSLVHLEMRMLGWRHSPPIWMSKEVWSLVWMAWWQCKNMCQCLPPLQCVSSTAAQSVKII